MAKNKTKIEVTTVFDGELDATDVFVSLISQKYGKTNTKEYLAKKKDLKYNEDEVQKSQNHFSFRRFHFSSVIFIKGQLWTNINK